MRFNGHAEKCPIQSQCIKTAMMQFKLSGVSQVISVKLRSPLQLRPIVYHRHAEYQLRMMHRLGK